MRMCDMRYFPSSVGYFVAMLANDEFGPNWPWGAGSLHECVYEFRSHELFLDLVGCLDADV